MLVLDLPRSEIPTMGNTVDPLDILKGIDSKFFLKKVKSLDILMKLNRSGVNIAKATGHHKIPNQLLKLAAPVISQALADFFNFSMESTTFPTDWNFAKIFPLFKNGERSDPSNYRPISVLPTIARVFERLVYKQMYSYFI